VSSISATVSHSSTLVVPAYAKLNLSLSVVARRPDGWHDIDSLLVPIDWHDLIGISVAHSAEDSVSLHVTGPAAEGVPVDESNLTFRAAHALGSLAARPLAIKVWLSKDVPHGAGLGGGSADAAAVLRAGASLLAGLGVAPDPQRLAAAAFDIGSDVPALLTLQAHRVRGRGDRLDAVPIRTIHLAVASTVPSSTADTYAEVDPAEIADDRRSERLGALLAAGRPADDALMGSSLEAAASRANPLLESALKRARAAVPEVRWHLTGSGGAVFSVARSHHHAEGLAARMRDAGFPSRACRTIG
jgi:4-diphosphocytidyl-2-C-methyl-D-erythritol kinase